MVILQWHELHKIKKWFLNHFLGIPIQPQILRCPVGLGVLVDSFNNTDVKLTGTQLLRVSQLQHISESKSFLILEGIAYSTAKQNANDVSCDDTHLHCFKIRVTTTSA